MLQITGCDPLPVIYVHAIYREKHVVSHNQGKKNLLFYKKGMEEKND